MVFSGNPHWWHFWRQVAAAIGLLLLLILMWSVDIDWLSTALRWIALAVFIVLVLDLIYEFIQWRTTKFAITDQRVAYQTGVIRRSGVSIPLNRINNVNFDQSIVARLLNNGVVTIESAGETGDSIFENIPKPQDVRTIIFAQMQADEQADSHRDAAAIRDALHGKPVPGAPEVAAAASSSVQARLSELEDLRRQGLINDEEFEAKRSRILDEL